MALYTYTQVSTKGYIFFLYHHHAFSLKAYLGRKFMIHSSGALFLFLILYILIHYTCYGYIFVITLLEAFNQIQENLSYVCLFWAVLWSLLLFSWGFIMGLDHFPISEVHTALWSAQCNSYKKILGKASLCMTFGFHRSFLVCTSFLFPPRKHRNAIYFELQYPIFEGRFTGTHSDCYSQLLLHLSSYTQVFWVVGVFFCIQYTYSLNHCVPLSHLHSLFAQLIPSLLSCPMSHNMCFESHGPLS